MNRQTLHSGSLVRPMPMGFENETYCAILSGGRWPGLGGWPDFAGFGNE
jgi:hypothetical protein